MRKPIKDHKKRILQPDSLYKSLLLTKMINMIMIGGKKQIASKIVYTVLDRISSTQNKSPLLFLQQAIDNIKPQVELKSRKIGGANYQVPVLVSVERQETLALRWLIEAANKNHTKTFIKSLETEIINSFNKEGGAIKKKLNIQKMAEANKAFSHFSW